MRREDWVFQMWSVVNDHMDAEFVWGVNDCCLFAARVVDAMTDSDHELDLLSQYSDEETALAYIAAHGSLALAISAHLGDETDGRAQRGDVVICANEGNPCAGICVGSTVAAVSKEGLVFIPRQDITNRWAI